MTIPNSHLTRRILAVPDTQAIAPSLTSTITSFGFHGVRADVHPGDEQHHHDRRWRQLTAYRDTTAFFIALIGTGYIDLTHDQLVQKSEDYALKVRASNFPHNRIAIEIGNEPDLAVLRWKHYPVDMAKCFAECYDRIKQHLPNVPVLCPSISNLDRDSIAYLSVMERYLPTDCAIAFHRYPNGPQVGIPHDGFSSRLEEVDRLQRIAGDRELWHTEGGWAEEDNHYTLTQEQVAELTVADYLFWRDQGVACWTSYQLNSARVLTTDTADERRLKTYGYRDSENHWKRVAYAMRATAAEERQRSE